MTDNGFDDELTEDEMSHLQSLLADPVVWTETDPADEVAIVAAIRAETGTAAMAGPADPLRSADESGATAPVIPLSRSRRWLAPALSAAAAAVITLAGFALLSTDDGPPAGSIEVALDGTDLAPGATGEAVVVELTAGTRIDLDVSGLEPAPPGSYYEAWLRQDAEVGVSAGTFHLRGGDDVIELWAGVSPELYPLITVTLQDEADTTSSGRVVLRGLLSTAD